MKKTHWAWMIIGCGLPLMFIFLAPSFGIVDGSSLFVFIIFMFAIHLFIPHGSHGHGRHDHSGENHTGHEHSKKELTEKSKDDDEHQHH